jgi:hypothetical protein
MSAHRDACKYCSTKFVAFNDGRRLVENNKGAVETYDGVCDDPVCMTKYKKDYDKLFERIHK